MSETILPAVSDPERLTVLRATGLLDTPQEERFDRIVRLTQRLLDVPVALISLVDDERQFFKGHRGLPAEWAERGETPLTHSFCQYAVATGQPLIVEDSREDAMLQRNLAIDDLDAVTYAGMPLEVSGQILGTLCVLDGEPREWKQEELEILQDLTALTASEIETRLLRQTTKEVGAITKRLGGPLEELGDALRSLVGAADGHPHESRFLQVANVARRHLDTVDRTVSHLRMAADADERRPTEAADLERRVRRAAEVASAVSGTRSFALELSGRPATIRCDAHGLERSLSALLLTALHHLGEDQAVTVRVRHDPDKVVLELDSPGPAMPVADLTRLVARFQELVREPTGRNTDAKVHVAGGTTTVDAGPVRGATGRAGLTFRWEVPRAS